MKKARALLALLLVFALSASASASNLSGQTQEAGPALLSQMQINQQNEWVLIVPEEAFSGSELKLKLSFSEQRPADQQKDSDGSDGSKPAEQSDSSQSGNESSPLEETGENSAAKSAEQSDDTGKAQSGSIFSADTASNWNQIVNKIAKKIRKKVEKKQNRKQSQTDEPQDTAQLASTVEPLSIMDLLEPAEDSEFVALTAAVQEPAADGQGTAKQEPAADGQGTAGQKPAADGQGTAGQEPAADSQENQKKENEKKDQSIVLVMSFPKDAYKENQNGENSYLAYRVTRNDHTYYAYVLQSVRGAQIVEATLSVVSVTGDQTVETPLELQLNGAPPISADDLKKDHFTTIVKLIVVAVVLLIIAVLLFLRFRSWNRAKREDSDSGEKTFELRVYHVREKDVNPFTFTDRNFVDLLDGKDNNGRDFREMSTTSSTGISVLRAELNRREGAVTVTVKQNDVQKSFLMNEEHRVAVIMAPNGSREELLRLYLVCTLSR